MVQIGNLINFSFEYFLYLKHIITIIHIVFLTKIKKGKRQKQLIKNKNNKIEVKEEKKL